MPCCQPSVEKKTLLSYPSAIRRNPDFKLGCAVLDHHSSRSTVLAPTASFVWPDAEASESEEEVEAGERRVKKSSLKRTAASTLTK